MAKQKPCAKAGRNLRSDAAKAATAARKLQAQKEQYATLLNSSAFSKAVAKGLDWVAPVQNPINSAEYAQCISALNDFLKKSKATVSEQQLDAAQNWVVTVEAKYYNSEKQQAILKLADTDVDAARHAALKFFREFKTAQTKVQEPTLGRIEFGVPSKVRRDREYKAFLARQAKKQKPVLKAKTVKGFAPVADPHTFVNPKYQKKEASVPTVVKPAVAVVETVNDPISQVEALIKKAAEKVASKEYDATLTEAENAVNEIYRETYQAELDRLKQWYSDYVEYEKALKQQRLEELEARKEAARQQAILDAERDFGLSLLPQKEIKKKEKAQKANPQIVRAQKLMRAAAALKGVDKQLDKRVKALGRAIEVNAPNLKKKFDFALSRYKVVKAAVEKVAA